MGLLVDGATAAADIPDQIGGDADGIDVQTGALDQIA